MSSSPSSSTTSSTCSKYFFVYGPCDFASSPWSSLPFIDSISALCFSICCSSSSTYSSSSFRSFVAFCVSLSCTASLSVRSVITADFSWSYFFSLVFYLHLLHLASPDFVLGMLDFLLFEAIIETSDNSSSMFGYRIPTRVAIWLCWGFCF